MLAFSKLNLSKQINFASKCFKVIPKVAGERNNFGSSFYGIDKFTRHSEFMNKRHANNIDYVRETVKRCVEKPEAKAFTEDIKTFLYLTKTDSDFDLLNKAIAKYHSQESSPIFNFRFGAPLMRLAYTLNKTNEMLQLYLQEESNYLHSAVTPGFILMNKLYEERRYDDCLKVFNRLIQALQAKEPSDSDYFPYDALKVAIEANLEKNDDESNKNAVQLFNTLKTIRPMQNPSKMVACLFLTAVYRSNVQLAQELCKYLESMQKMSMVVSNLKIICYCLEKKTEEALAMAQSELKQDRAERKNALFFFKITIDSLKELVEASKNDENKKVLDEIMNMIKTENLIAKTDLKEYATKQVNFTAAERERLRTERERERDSNPDRRNTDSFRSRDQFGSPRRNNERNQQFGGGERRSTQQRQPGSDDEIDERSPQTNSPKNRRQYLE